MRIIKYSAARENLRKELDIVAESSQPTCIVSKSNQVVLISKKEYDAIMKRIGGSNES
jgi:prevent-host-death family protein